MTVTTHERPGVYSAYEASSLIRGGSRGRVVGLVAVNTAATAGEVHLITGYEQGVQVFGTAGEMARLISLALQNGAAAVAAVAIAGMSGYAAAFETLALRDDVSIFICGSTDLSVQQSLRDTVNARSARRRECIAVVAGTPAESVAQYIIRSSGLNSERVVLVAPGALNAAGEKASGLEVAAAVAGAIAGESDPAVPLGGAVLKGLYGLGATYSDSELDLLIPGGITPVEQLGGSVSVVRAVTTRTTTDGADDPTWRELSTILIVDTVIPALRDSLRAKFRRAKNTPRGRGAIRAQVVLELEHFLQREIITAYDGVAVTADESDPTRAIVDFSFTVAHGLNQIWLTAHITV